MTVQIHFDSEKFFAFEVVDGQKRYIAHCSPLSPRQQMDIMHGHHSDADVIRRGNFLCSEYAKVKG